MQDKYITFKWLIFAHHLANLFLINILLIEFLVLSIEKFGKSNLRSNNWHQYLKAPFRNDLSLHQQVHKDKI